MSPGSTADRVYLALKLQIMHGERQPGAHLDPAKLAADLNTSTTPVRDALHQLLGERMVQAWPGQGFQVPLPTESGLRNLYRWNSDLITLLLRGWRPVKVPGKPIAGCQDDAANMAATLFDAIAATLGNPEHRRAVRQASDRLHRARRAEAEVFADLPRQHHEMVRAWTGGRAAELRAAILRYHRRRHKIVGQIIAQMTAGDLQ